MTTGQRIKAARKRAGITQEDLGEKLGVSGSMIAQYETDKRNPKKETLMKIANALGISRYDLLTKEARKIYDIGAKEGQEAADFYNRQVDEAWEMLGYTHSDVECDLIEAFSQLNDGNQQKVKNYAQDLAKVPEYRRQEAPQPPPASVEGKDTTPAEPPPESPPEGG